MKKWNGFVPMKLDCGTHRQQKAQIQRVKRNSRAGESAAVTNFKSSNYFFSGLAAGLVAGAFAAFASLSPSFLKY
jgi:hypothetical protein